MHTPSPMCATLIFMQYTDEVNIGCFLDSLRHYVRMFQSVQRLQQMYRYYEHFHKSEISKSWSALMDSDKALPQSLALFYDTIISIFHTQVRLRYIIAVGLQVWCSISQRFHAHLCRYCNVL